ncbi:MAG: peptide deformylase [Opitutaceae bacterium]
MALPIVHYNAPILRKKGARVTAFDAELERFARALIDAMHEAEGIGLAAQQVGRPLQMFVADLRGSDAEYQWTLDGGHPPRDLFMPLVFVNPEVKVAPGTPEAVAEEGCLSFPGVRGDVKRPNALTASFRDEKGTPHLLACDGLLARCILHELDHVTGILFTDRMDKKTRASIDAALKALAKKTRAEKAGAGP